MCFRKDGAVPALSGNPLKFVDKFTYLDRNISSTEVEVNMRNGKLWSAIDKWSII